MNAARSSGLKRSIDSSIRRRNSFSALFGRGVLKDSRGGRIWLYFARESAHRHTRRPDGGPLLVAESNRMGHCWRRGDQSKRYNPGRTSALPTMPLWPATKMRRPPSGKITGASVIGLSLGRLRRCRAQAD